jgi:hypothetical protein
MTVLKAFSFLILMLLIFTGCGPYYRTVISMEPVKTGAYAVNSAEMACSVEKEGVKITLVFEKRKNLEAVSQQSSWNPYLNEQKLFFYVFKFTVENDGQNKIFIDTGKTVLLDGLGGQLNALSLDYFRALYPVTTILEQNTRFRGDAYFDKTVIYTDDYYRLNEAEKTLFVNGELYPGVKREGYIVFEQVKQGAGKITVHLSGITLKEGAKPEEISFEYLHNVSIKEIK